MNINRRISYNKAPAGYVTVCSNLERCPDVQLIDYRFESLEIFKFVLEVNVMAYVHKYVRGSLDPYVKYVYYMYCVIPNLQIPEICAVKLQTYQRRRTP